MSKPDISRREPTKVQTIRQNGSRQETTEDNAVRDDEFYETMPMATQPLVREQTTVTTKPIDEQGENINGILLFAERVISYITGVVLALLGLRFILAVFSYFEVISTANGFARLIYSITNPLIAPFSSLFNTSNTDPGLWAIGFAILIYGLISFAIIRLFRIGQPKYL